MTVDAGQIALVTGASFVVTGRQHDRSGKRVGAGRATIPGFDELGL
jgi:hypothetical protein